VGIGLVFARVQGQQGQGPVTPSHVVGQRRIRAVCQTCGNLWRTGSAHVVIARHKHQAPGRGPARLQQHARQVRRRIKGRTARVAIPHQHVGLDRLDPRAKGFDGWPVFMRVVDDGHADPACGRVWDHEALRGPGHRFASAQPVGVLVTQRLCDHAIGDLSPGAAPVTERDWHHQRPVRRLDQPGAAGHRSLVESLGR